MPGSLIRAFVILAAATLLGCAGARATWNGPAAPPPRPDATGPAAPDAQPDPADPFARDTRAEALLGRLGLATARVRAASERARARRDVVFLACLADKLGALEELEERARDRRAALRAAAIDDPRASDSAWTELGGLESQATSIAEGAKGCVGEEAQEVTVTGGNYAVRVRDLENRVDDLKQNIRRSHTRNALLTEGVLAGTVGGLRGPDVSTTRGAVGPPPVAARAAAPPTAAAGAAHDASMLLRSAQLTLAVFEVEKKMDAVVASAAELGGYLALRGDRSVTVRVPRDRFDEALKRVEKLGDVLHRSVAAEDVTDQYVDLELRLKNAHGVRARLEKLLETATVKDAIEIQKELARITEEIERFEGKLKLLRDRIAFSTITVTFERTEPQKVRTQALLPFAFMRTLGLGPLLQVQR